MEDARAPLLEEGGVLNGVKEREGGAMHDEEGPVTPLDVEVERIGVGTFHYVAVGVLGLCNASDAVELLAIGYILPVLSSSSTSDGIHITDAQKGFLSAAVFVGMLVGGLICGALSDRMGRKSMLLASLGINALAGLSSSVMPNWPSLLATRVVSGIGVGGSVPSVFTMAVEYLPVERRGLLLTVVAWHWMLGSIFTAGLAWTLLGAVGASWRVFLASCAGPASIAFVLVAWLLPETPRYLATKGRYAAAASVLNGIAKRCGQDPHLSPSGSELVGPSKADAGQDSGVASPGAVSGAAALSGSVHNTESSVNTELEKEEEEKETPSWTELFNPSLRRTTVSLIVVWFGLSFGWYGLILWIPTLFEDANLTLGIYASTFLVAAANLPGNIASAFLMDRLGRKNVMVGTMAIAAGLGVLFAFSHSAFAVITVASLFNGVSIGGWNALDCLSSESFPTPLRTTAMGLLAAFGRLGSMSAQFVNGFLISHSVALLLFVTAGTMALSSIGALFLPRDTANRRVEDEI